MVWRGEISPERARSVTVVLNETCSSDHGPDLNLLHALEPPRDGLKELWVSVLSWLLRGKGNS